MINKRTSLLTIIFCSCILLTISSCVKKDPESRITQVLLVPLSPNATACDFSINGTLYATTVGYSSTAGTIRYTLPYYTIEPKAGSVIAYNVTGTPNKFASVSADLAEDLPVDPRAHVGNERGPQGARALPGRYVQGAARDSRL